MNHIERPSRNRATAQSASAHGRDCTYRSNSVCSLKAPPGYPPDVMSRTGTIVVVSAVAVILIAVGLIVDVLAIAAAGLVLAGVLCFVFPHEATEMGKGAP